MPFPFIAQMVFALACVAFSLLYSKHGGHEQAAMFLCAGFIILAIATGGVRG